ncbi:hypothetical protein D9758_007959 [Tetrapyrgos nigripes]|uniref:DUF6533 domain-containing protein n=1 Tax=Tetrapyrgos nigripes TaxID=182062 RepID=A0A8H5D585_9AGAR|nr:hypothetical protein D9758_007959 [Tetrapyrgos nigripes]
MYALVSHGRSGDGVNKKNFKLKTVCSNPPFPPRTAWLHYFCSLFYTMSSSIVQGAYYINDQRLANYFHLVGFVFLVWDHVLTFPLEVKYIWRRSFNTTTWAILFNRYFPVIGTVIMTINAFDGSLPHSMYKLLIARFSCEPLHIFHEAYLFVTEVNVCLLLTLRIYAIYDRNKRVLGFMAFVGLILGGLALFASFYTFVPSTDPPVSLTSMGCHTDLDVIPHGAQEAAAWEALFVYDCLLFTMIILKGRKTRRSVGRVPLLDIIIQDGASYFGVMAVANLANILTFYFAGPSTRGGLSTFSNAVSVTMMSRLTFHLHENAKIDSFQPGSTAQSSTVLTSAPDAYQDTCQFTSYGYDRSEQHPPYVDRGNAHEAADDEERQVGGLGIPMRTISRENVVYGESSNKK